MWEGITQGLGTALDPANLVWVAAGCCAGTLIGMLPGLGPITAIALMIPVSYTLEPAAGLIMMAGVYYGAVFGGSTSSILINAPGVASTVATSFDGYPMARAGEAGRALAIAAYASFAGGTIGAIALLLFAGALASWATAFQSPEYTLILVFALSSIAAFAERGRVAKSCVAALLGLMLGTVGTDQSAGVQRFTFGRLDLMDGISFILLAMAVFALAEAFHMLTTRERGGDYRPAASVRLKKGDARAITPTVGRNSALGFLVGILPGAGATLASFFAYDFEKRFNRNPACGIAAPEAANNAACTGGVLGRDRLHVHRQLGAVGAEPAVDPLHLATDPGVPTRADPLRRGVLPRRRIPHDLERLRPLSHARLRHRGPDPAFLELSARISAARLHPERHAGGQSPANALSRRRIAIDAPGSSGDGRARHRLRRDLAGPGDSLVAIEA